MKKMKVLVVGLVVFLAFSLSLGITNLASTYTVIKGDNLWNIAREKFGDGKRYVEIYDANKDQINNPSLIYPGQVLGIPDEEDEGESAVVEETIPESTDSMTNVGEPEPIIEDTASDSSETVEMMFPARRVVAYIHPVKVLLVLLSTTLLLLFVYYMFSYQKPERRV